MLARVGSFAAIILIASAAQAASETRTSAFTYDATTGLLAKEIVEPDDANLCLVTEYTYDTYGNVLTTTTRNCNGSSGGGVTEAAAPSGTAVIQSRIASSQYQAGSAVIGGVTYSYPAGRLATTSTNALNQSETNIYDARFGTVISLTGPNALTTTWTYDGFGRKASETRADGTSTTWTYTLGTIADCPSTTAYHIIATATASPTSTVCYDKLNRQVRAITVGFDGTSKIFQDTEYDSQGRVFKASSPYYSGQTAQWTCNEYDLLSRITRQRFAVVGNSNASCNSTTYTDTAYNGLTVTVTNPKGQTQTTIRNSQGQAIEIKDAANYSLLYTYDPFGNLKTTTDPATNVASFNYDKRGRKTSMTDPDMGYWTYRYNALGELVWQCDPVGRATGSTGSPADCTDATATRSTYDKLGRILTRTERDFVSTWVYDTATKGVGKLASVSTDNGYGRVHTYDSLGRPSQTTTTTDTAYAQTVTYDANGRIATNTYPTGFAVKYVYTSLGYLKEVRNNSTNALYWQADVVDAQGHLTQQTYGNGVQNFKTYEAATGRLTGATAGAGNAVQNMAYTYDSIGNLETRQDNILTQIEDFDYDNLNRLTQSAIQGSGITGTITKTLTYNAIGNILTKTGVGTYAYPAAGTARPHAVSSTTGTINATFTYDVNGNLFTKNSIVNTWTSFNAPWALGGTNFSTSFVYGPEHQRVRQISIDTRTSTTLTTTTYYLHPGGGAGLFYEKETKSPGLIEHKHFIQAGATTIALYTTRSDTTTAIRYFHHDHLGSISVITDGAGAVVERLAYDAWGKRRQPNGNDDPGNTIAGVNTDRGYTNHEHIDEITLIHMNGRIYDPTIGRFLSADPFIQSPADLQNYNRYSYVRNNPLAYSDPSGYLLKALKKLGKKIDDLNHSIGRHLDRSTRMAFRPQNFGQHMMGMTQILHPGQAMIDNYLSKHPKAAAVVTVAGQVACGFTGPFAPACAAGVAAYSTAVMGGSDGKIFQAGVRAAAASYVTGSVGRTYGNTYSVERVVASGFAGGVAAELQGGEFRNGFLMGTAASGARYAYNKLAGYDATLKPGENVPEGGDTSYEPREDGRIPFEKSRDNIIGFNNNYNSNGGFFDQGSPFSKALNIVPGVNAIGRLDDFMNNYANIANPSAMLGDTIWFKFITIPASVVITAPALVDGANIY